MVTNVPMHAGEASVLRSFVFNEDGFPGLKKPSVKIACDLTSTTRRDVGDGRACNLLSSTLISIVVFEKSGVALDY